MAVDFLINEKQLAHYEQLENSKWKQPDSIFTVLLPDNSLYLYPGKISVIDRAVDAQTGAIRIRLVFPNPKYTLKAGMSCVVREHNQEATPQLLVPGKAVVEQMGEYFVFVARDTVLSNTEDGNKTNNGDTAQAQPRLRAFQKKVQLGQTIGPNVIIGAGIEPGDRIVVDGIQALHEGSEITISDKRTLAQKGKNGQE
jgi:membrane fusion protein (multidrug efflux system)